MSSILWWAVGWVHVEDLEAKLEFAEYQRHYINELMRLDFGYWLRIHAWYMKRQAQGKPLGPRSFFLFMQPPRPFHYEWASWGPIRSANDPPHTIRELWEVKKG